MVGFSPICAAPSIDMKVARVILGLQVGLYRNRQALAI